MSSPQPLPVHALTLKEVIGIAGDLQTLVGAQLQECLQSASEFGMGFYHDRKIRWLWFDLDPRRPFVLLLEEPPPVKKLMRPLSLFVRSHFRGRRLKSVTAKIESGRVLILEFHRSQEEDSSGTIALEVRLLPHAPNIIAHFHDKQVSESKPKDLPNAPVEIREDESSRSLSEMTAAWLELKKNRPVPGQRKKYTPEQEWARAIEKKEEALVRMQKELEEKSSRRERDLGDWLKTNRTLSVPPEFSDLIDVKKSVAWNIEEVFRRAKDKERKIEGTRARLAIVEKEIAELKKSGPRAEPESSTSKSLLAKAEARGRRFKLSGDLDVYVGKSAADNLALLRRAQPFDYWLHLRDQPGSHAILRRSRGRNVTDQEFTSAAKWVIEESLKKSANELKGERHDVLIVECRFVRPIKGDKLGRVNYSNDRVLSVRF